MLLKKKICMLGAIGVGKTCLVRRFVEGMFDDRYLATIGVKIGEKLVRVGKADIAMVIWDIAGAYGGAEDTPAYFKGSEGYIVVNDGTRPESFQLGRDILHFASDISGERPSIMLLNKVDLLYDWVVSEDEENELSQGVHALFKTSAKTGLAVESAFSTLARKMNEGSQP